MTTKANRRGEVRKRRSHRAQRRAATLPIQQTFNDMMREQNHPGWSEKAPPEYANRWKWEDE